MTRDAASLRSARWGALRIRHHPSLTPEQVARAIAEHRRNAARPREACEHWGAASSVSRVALVTEAGRLDLAVKWNHGRGLRRALSDSLRRSRAARAARGAERLGALGIRHPETLAVAERRRLGAVVESFLVTPFLSRAAPLPAAMLALRGDAPARRRAARSLGRTIGRLHAAGLDHPDLKHSNLMLGEDGEITLLDLDALRRFRGPGWRRRVRALGQLEAYASDLYPWLPRTDRVRFLRAYLEPGPDLGRGRRELVADVRVRVMDQLSRWAGQDRRYHHAFPLGPRTPEPSPAGSGPARAETEGVRKPGPAG